MSLTTPSRVRNRVPLSGIPDYVIEEFITDAESWVEAFVGRDITTSDNYYELARSVCTNKTTVLLILHELKNSFGDRREILSRLLEEFQTLVAEEKNTLRRIIP